SPLSRRGRIRASARAWGVIEFASRSAQELKDVACEQLRILKEETMPRFSIENELCIGQALRQDIGVVRMDHDVERAVGHEYGDRDLAKAWQSRIDPLAPGSQGRELSFYTFRLDG